MQQHCGPMRLVRPRQRGGSTWAGLFGLSVLLLALAGCSDDAAKGGSGNRAADGAGAGSGDGSSGTLAFPAGTGTGSPLAGSVSTAGTQEVDTPAVNANDCGGTAVEPKTIEVVTEVEITEAEPVAIYIMLDNSGSMVPLWPGAMTAISDFVSDSKSAGLDVAFQIFPGTAAGCDAAVYETPLVPLGRLPAHAPNITASFPAFPFGSGTNIEPAIRGATEFCKKFTPADPADAGEKCVVLFITDGAPSTCNGDLAMLAQIAGDAYTNSGVQTFTIALQGANVAFLDDMAAKGGGDCDPMAALNTCDLTTGASFADALSAIRDTVTTIETRVEMVKQALECEWGLPDPNPGETFDKTLVNVNFQAAPATAAVGFKNVPNQAACGDNAGAWYYDDAANPTRILACPKTCDAVKAATDARVDVVLGCPIELVDVE
jgi:Mg-chelatase subunit ChlD